MSYNMSEKSAVAVKAKITAPTSVDVPIFVKTQLPTSAIEEGFMEECET